MMGKLDSKNLKLLFLFFLFAYTSQATTYYVSSSGSNYNSGTSVDKAWASVLAVNSRKFLPGDIILFEGGRTFSGGLYFDATDRGTPSAPIIIGSYGNGEATINSGSSYGMYVYNTAGFKISNLVFKGSGRTTNNMAGIFFYMDRGNTRLDFVHIDGVEVYGYKGSGVMIGSDNKTGGYDNVKVTNSSLHDNGVAGISSYAQGISHRNFYLANNKVFNNPGVPEERRIHTGSGIMLGGVDGAVIEYCEAYNNGWLNGWDGGGPVGIWAYDSNEIIIQHNESHHNKTGTTKDGGGFDLDGGVTNSVMQYNYSHDNDGAGYLLAQYSGAPAMKNLVIRYNISENDGRKNSNAGILLWATNSSGGMQNVDIYNNTVYLSPASNGSPTGIFVSTGYITNAKVRNNIIQATGGLQLVRALANTDIRFENNAYWSSGNDLNIYWTGTTYNSLEKWRNATKQEILNGKSVGVFTNPELSNPGKGGTIGNPGQLQSLAAYKLKAGSDIIGAGLNLKNTFNLNPGEVDFWKNNISKKQSYNIGAYELGESVAKTPQSQTITFTDIADKVYGAAPFALQATASSGLLVSFEIASGPATLKANTITLTGTGTVTITATQNGNEDFKAAPAVSQSFKVTKKALENTTLSFTTQENKKEGDAPFELTATSNNPETPILFTSSNQAVIAVAKISGKWLATVGEAGTAIITATQAGNDEYAAAANVTRTIVVKSVNTTPNIPVSPGFNKYEAEDYADMSGIETQTTSDDGGGLNVGWIDANDWINYTVNVSNAGTYTLNFRVASNSSGQFEVRNSSGTVLKAVDVPRTDGWQDWATISVPVTLRAGSQTLQIYIKEAGWNLNWFEITNAAVAGNDSDAIAEENRIKVVAVSPSEDTGMDYTPWLNDNMEDLIAPSWQSDHHKYVDVTLTLEQTSRLSRISLYDDKGMFTATPVEVYALYNTKKTLLGRFTGEAYQEWIDIAGQDLVAEAIIIRKYGNDIPLKIKVFGTPVTTQVALRTSVNSVASEMAAATTEKQTLKGTAGVTWSVYPNPTPDKVEIQLNPEIFGEVTLDLLDGNGKVLNHLTLQKKEDFLTESLSLNNLKNGMYIIQLRAPGIRSEKKIIKR